MVRSPGKGEGGQTGRAAGPIARFWRRSHPHASGHGVNMRAMCLIWLRHHTLPLAYPPALPTRLDPAQLADLPVDVRDREALGIQSSLCILLISLLF